MDMAQVREQTAFSVEELQVLSECLTSQSIFGLPEKKVLNLVDANYQKKALKHLQEKELFTADYMPTKAGAVVIESIEKYMRAPRYVGINQIWLGVYEDGTCVALYPKKVNQSYRVIVTNTILFFKDFFKNNIVLRREPQEDEKGFFIKKSRNREKRMLRELPYPEEKIAWEYIDRSKPEIMPKGEHPYWLFFEISGILYGENINENQLYQVSQYGLMKMLFDSLAIPYEVEGTRDE